MTNQVKGSNGAPKAALDTSYAERQRDKVRINWNDEPVGGEQDGGTGGLKSLSHAECSPVLA